MHKGTKCKTDTYLGLQQLYTYICMHYIYPLHQNEKKWDFYTQLLGQRQEHIKCILPLYECSCPHFDRLNSETCQTAQYVHFC